MGVEGLAELVVREDDPPEFGGQRAGLQTCGPGGGTVPLR
jgi:hypothetical protein